MRLDQAKNLKEGDVVFNCFGDKLVVTGISVLSKDNSISSVEIIINTVSTSLNKESYYYDSLYNKDYESESDDELSWIDWAKKNREDIEEFCLESMKQAFKSGFISGFNFKRKITSEEMLQK